MPVESRFSRHSKGSALIRKGEVRQRPITELEYTMETMQRLISEIVVKYILIFYVLLKRVLVKSRMWEIHKSGSLRGMRLLTLNLLI